MGGWPGEHADDVPHHPRRVSTRIGSIAESATLAVDAKAKALKAQGRPVIGFGAGEPDFPTPEAIVEAAVEAARQPANHRYTPAGGLPDLKQAIVAKTLRDSGYQVGADQVLVTNGGKQAVYQTFATLLDPGDEVLLPAPYWTTYPECVRLAGGVPVEVFAGPDQGYLVTVDQARGRPHRAHQGAALLLAVQPDRRRLPARAGARRRRVGPRARHLGRHRRDLRAPGVRRRAVRVDAGRGARARRHLRGAERRGQDVRDDRLAGGLDDRPEGRREGGHQPAVARHVERRERLAAGRGHRAHRRPVGRARDARGLRPPPPHHGVDAERDRRRRVPHADRRVLRLPLGRGRARSVDPRPGAHDVRRAWPASSSTRSRWRSCRARPSGRAGSCGCRTHWATTTSSRASAGSSGCSRSEHRAGPRRPAEGPPPPALHRLHAVGDAGRAWRGGTACGCPPP
nr:aminotransferase class I/II-fold pyridoxal phosphate-dependent enzyme [Angustibacter aerolatus]